MSSPSVEDIDRSTLSDVERNALAILEHLSVADLNELKRVLHLSVPGVVGPDTLETFVSVARDVPLDLTNAGVNQFKDDHQLGNTGQVAGVIGRQTATVYVHTVLEAIRPNGQGATGTLFCDFAERDDQGANDAGPFVGGPPRGVLHSTEGSTAAGARSAFVEFDSWPHFTITNENGHVRTLQHLPIDRAARSLEHRGGTVETNRQGAIQIEIVGFAAHADAFPQSYLDGIARLMRWIEKNAGVQRSTSVEFVPPGQEQRLSDGDWLKYDGWCGHQHVPNNEHEDPGAIAIGKLLA
jgi:N-acetylmuramoyl-L-alanine amidase